jgi:choice-of-anchor B domain-containing protein
MPSRTPLARLWPLALLLAAPPAWSHAQHDQPRFVASDGDDAGQCDDRAAPCLTIGYAARRAGKGDQILVARGRYGIHSADELFYVLSGIVRLRGGYSRADAFARQAPSEQPTLLMGVPPQLRERLERQGFQVIADSKGLDAQTQAAMRAASRSLALMERSAAAASCAGGSAGGFACEKIDLFAHLALGDFSSAPAAGNDVWGFADLNTEREYALVGLRDGTAVVDVTDPTAPFEVGTIAGDGSTWRDVKVYQYYDRSAGRWHAYAYVSTDAQIDKLTIIDLGGLPNHVALASHGTDETRAHNVYVANVDYSTGIPRDGLDAMLLTMGSDRSGGGFRSYQLTNPAHPALLAASPTQHYTHDASSFLITDARKDSQCEHAGTACVLLLDFNETTVDLWDASDPRDPRQLSSTTYANAGYVHSGWPSEDGAYMFVQDELDERDAGLLTTLRVFSLADLGAPMLAGTWTGPTAAIDHNGYVRGNRYYMSNYTRGLTILDITQPQTPVAVARFDTYMASDATSFNGAWGVYPFLPSGHLLVNDINSGLYVLGDGSLDDAHGSLQFTARSFGGVGGGSVAVEIARTGGTSGAVSVAYATLSGTADSADYEPMQGRLSWDAGDASSRTVSIPLRADGVIAAPRRFFLRLYDPQGGATLRAPSTTSIYASDAGAMPELDFADERYVARAGAGRVLLVVQRHGSAEGAVMVDYRTVGATAAPGVDYVDAGTGTLSWADGDGSARSIVVALLPAAGSNSGAEFQVELFNARGAALGTLAAASVTLGNRAPSAQAGEDRSVDAGATVALQGAQSSDPDGDPLQFAWLQTAGPPVTLTQADAATAHFTAPGAGAAPLTFQLTATDPAGNAAADSTTISVAATVPAPSGAADSGGGVVGPLVLVLLLLQSIARCVRAVRPRRKLR